MKKLLVLAAQVALLVACGVPQVHMMSHRPDMAATAAEEFARVAFVEQDSRRAYDLTADELKKAWTLDVFVKNMTELHHSRYPSQVAATDYEPIPGQPAMNVFLRGQNGDEEFYYRFTMLGTEERGYRVMGFFRGSGPYPPSPSRKSLGGNEGAPSR